jgi:RNA polymerase sigma factor (sigma-70 family)
MSDRPLRTVLHRLGSLLGRDSGAALTDAELVERFVASRDSAAFELLVYRHGPMVLGVGRRILRHQQDAEDAFQATFLVFARKAASIGKSAAVASWLYKVAFRAALKARARGAARRMQALPDVAAPAASDDLHEALETAIQALPARYRDPFILCYLQGRTVDEAARELGCPRGTVLSRLSRGRQRVRARLARDGVAVGAALAAATAPARASVPAALFRATLPGNVHSPSAVALSHTVIRSMSLTNLRTALACALVAVLVLGGLDYLVRPPADAMAPQSAAVAPVPVAQPQQPEKLKEPLVLKHRDRVLGLAFSPDGKWLAAGEGVKGMKVHVYDMPSGKERQTFADLPGPVHDLAVSPDGKLLAAACTRFTERDGKVIVWDTATWKEKTAIDVPAPPKNGGLGGAYSLAFSPDSGTLALGCEDGNLRLWDVKAGKEIKVIQVIKGCLATAAFSPDGKWLAVGGPMGVTPGQLVVYETAMWKEQGRYKGPDRAFTSVSFSRDSKHLAAGAANGDVYWIDVAAGTQKITQAPYLNYIVACVTVSPDGKYIVTGDWENHIKYVEIATGKVVGTVDGNEQPVDRVAFNRAGDLLASAGYDGTVRLWPVAGPPKAGPPKKE